MTETKLEEIETEIKNFSRKSLRKLAMQAGTFLHDRLCRYKRELNHPLKPCHHYVIKSHAFDDANIQYINIEYHNLLNSCKVIVFPVIVIILR